MTEREYECIYEHKVDKVPEGMSGEVMTLREWLILTGRYDYSFEEASDNALIEYMREFRGKYLREV